MHNPPQDIPFYPDWLHRELPPEHRKTWCIAARLTERLRARGYTLAITPGRNKQMEEAHAAEVRAAVRERLTRFVEAAQRCNYTPAAIVHELLQDPAVTILIDHYDREAAPAARLVAGGRA